MSADNQVLPLYRRFMPKAECSRRLFLIRGQECLSRKHFLRLTNSVSAQKRIAAKTPAIRG